MGRDHQSNMRHPSTCFALLVVAAAQFLSSPSTLAAAVAPPRKLFTCSVNNTCVTVDRGTSGGSALPVCLLTCGAGPVWPLPSKSTIVGTVSAFSRCNINMQFSSTSADVKNLLMASGKHLMDALAANKQTAGTACLKILVASPSTSKWNPPNQRTPRPLTRATRCAQS